MDDPSQSNDANQVGTNTQQSLMPSQPNYLTPQQRMQMSQYANSLMQNQQPNHSMTQGLGNMVNSFMGGEMASRANPTNGGPSGILGSLFGGPPPVSGSGAPMQLPSATGGSSPMNILQGLFGGGSASGPTS